MFWDVWLLCFVGVVFVVVVAAFSVFLIVFAVVVVAFVVCGLLFVLVLFPCICGLIFSTTSGDDII